MCVCCFANRMSVCVGDGEDHGVHGRVAVVWSVCARSVWSQSLVRPPSPPPHIHTPSSPPSPHTFPVNFLSISVIFSVNFPPSKHTHPLPHTTPDDDTTFLSFACTHMSEEARLQLSGRGGGEGFLCQQRIHLSNERVQHMRVRQRPTTPQTIHQTRLEEKQRVRLYSSRWGKAYETSPSCSGEVSRQATFRSTRRIILPLRVC